MNNLKNNMNKDQETEDNRAIMALMGLTNPCEYFGRYSISVNHCTCNEETAEKAINGFASIAKYNEDWNWLMPVVERIEGLLYEDFTPVYVEMHGTWCEIKVTCTIQAHAPTIQFRCNTKKESVHKAVSKFAKWYRDRNIKAIYKMTPAEIYLDWKNDWLTLERMSEHYGITETDLTTLINLGRIEHENNVQALKAEQPPVRCVDIDEMPKILDFEKTDFTEEEMELWINGEESYLDNERTGFESYLGVEPEHIYSLSLTDADHEWKNEIEEMPDTLRKKLDYVREVMDKRDASYFRLR